MEVWQVIPGFGGAYEASSLGRIRSKDRAENLEWCTRSENSEHARRIGLVRDEKPIIATPKNGGEAIMFRSISDAARHLGKRKSNIQSAAHGRIPSAYGFRWKIAA